MELLNYLMIGFSVALQPMNLFYCFLGVLIGTLVGVLPGIGPPAGMALLLPLTFGWSPDTALIFMGAIFFSSNCGGSITSILINAPGINSATPFFEITEDEYEKIMKINLKSMFLACQIYGKQMVDQGKGGSIINISSVSSGPPLSRVFTYSLSKAGVNNLTQFLAREWALHKVRVNAIAPGFFPAEQNRKILTQDRVENIFRHTPMNRYGEPEELVGAVIWLCSERASSFVTGAIIRVDGGYTAMTI